MAQTEKNPAGKKKVPERQCVGCREKREKRDFIRVVRSPEGNVSIDFTGKKSGRGAYLCKNSACLKKARKTGVLARQLNCEITDEIYAELTKEIELDEKLADNN